MSRVGKASGAVLVLGALAALGLWVAGGAESPPVVELDHTRKKPQGGFYTMSLAEPLSLNPFRTSDGVALRIVLPRTHDALMEFDPTTAEMRPSLAERVEVNGLDMVFTIRAGAEFSDGSALTAQDLAFGFELQHSGVALGGMRSVLENVASVDAPDARTLKVTLKTRTFATVEAFATGYTVAKRSYFLGEVARLAAAAGEETPSMGSDRFRRLFAAVRHPGPGTGPYKFARWTPGHDIYIIQNRRSWRLAARPEDWNLAGLRLRFVSDPAACLALAKAEELDLYSDYEAPNLMKSMPGLAATHRVLRYDHIGNGRFLVVWNHRRKPFDNPTVRAALTRLFDRDEILKIAFAGSGEVPRTWFPPGSALDLPREFTIPFDPAEARELLEQAGASGLSVDLVYPGEHPVHTDIMNIAIPAFEEAGVGLKPKPQEFGALVARLQNGEFDGLLIYLGASKHIDPYLHFHASQIKDGQNWMGYDDTEVNGLLRSAREELDDKKRMAMFQRFNAIFLVDQPVTLLAHPLSSVILARRFQGVKPGLMGLSFEKWWVESAAAHAR